MARINIEAEEAEAVSLDLLIPRYFANKIEADSYKKLVDADNTEIKRLMRESNESEVTYDGLVAKVTIQKRESFDEAKLINVLENSTYTEEGVVGPICVATGLGIVKMKPYVDMDALEDAIYKGKLDDEVIARIASCKEVKEVETLKVSRIKQKKENKDE